MRSSIDKRLLSIELRMRKPSVVDRIPELAAFPEIVRMIDSGTAEERDQLRMALEQNLREEAAAST